MFVDRTRNKRLESVKTLQVLVISQQHNSIKTNDTGYRLSNMTARISQDFEKRNFCALLQVLHLFNKLFLVCVDFTVLCLFRHGC